MVVFFSLTVFVVIDIYYWNQRIVSNDPDDEGMKEGKMRNVKVVYLKVSCGDDESIRLIPIKAYLVFVEGYKIGSAVCYGRGYDRLYFIKY